MISRSVSAAIDVINLFSSTGGEDDDGFVLYLKKMNLELFKGKDSKPSDSWWDRLFNYHGDIRFDDYDKDFTDLPAPIAEVRARGGTSRLVSGTTNLVDL